MAIVELEPAGDYTPLESNWYTATLLSVTERDRPADTYHEQPYRDLELQWAVAVPATEDTEASTAEIRSWATLVRTFNEKAKLVLMMKALGVADENGVLEGDTEQWIGRKCRINVIERIKGDGSTGNKVDGYAPIRAARPAQPAAPAAATPAAQPTPARKPAAVAMKPGTASVNAALSAAADPEYDSAF